MSCLVSASNHMVVLRASSSSLVSQSLARSHIQGGSVTWASQSKVGKSLVMGANCCMGILGLLLGMRWLQNSALGDDCISSVPYRAMFHSPLQHCRRPNFAKAIDFQ